MTISHKRMGWIQFEKNDVFMLLCLDLINSLKNIVHCMYHLIQRSVTLHFFPQSVFGVACDSQNKQ
jgi:hypothetical protein